MRLVSLVAAVAILAVPSAAATPRAPTERVTVYFLVDDGTAPLGVRTEVVRRGREPLARLALAKLLRGPAAAGAHGVTTALPRGTTIAAFRIDRRRRGSIATIDLRGLPSLRAAGARRIAQVGTQVARTVIGLSDVEQVRLRANGGPWSFWTMDGAVSTAAWNYELLVGLWVNGFKAIP